MRVRVCVCGCIYSMCSLTPKHLPLAVHLRDLWSKVLLLKLPLNTQRHQVRSHSCSHHTGGPLCVHVAEEYRPSLFQVLEMDSLTLEQRTFYCIHASRTAFCVCVGHDMGQRLLFNGFVHTAKWSAVYLIQAHTHTHN